MTSYKRAREWMDENKKNNPHSDLAFALIPEKEEDEGWDVQHAACFASMRHVSKEGRFAYFIMQQFGKRMMNGKRLESFEKNYLEWLARRSPLARAFRTKQPDIMAERGTVFWTKDTPQYVFMAAVAARYVSEFPFIPKMWDKLREHISEEDAFVLAHFVNEGGDKIHVGLSGNTNHHCFISCNFGKEEFQAFREHKEYEHKEVETLRTNRNYYGSTLNFKKGALPDFEEWGIPSWLTTPLDLPIAKMTKNQWGDSVRSLTWDNVEEWARKWVEDNT